MAWVITPLLGILLAAGLGLVIGFEREFFVKAAGLRTNTLVAMGAAVFTEVSRYGFLGDGTGVATGDTARVAAQIVTGVGFLGAGLIFVRKDAVRGLTTAAGIWFAAAVGMAAGAGLYLVAVASTALYLVVMVVTRPLERVLPRARSTVRTLDITYADGQGVLRDIIEAAAKRSVTVVDFTVRGGHDVRGEPAQAIRLIASGRAVALDHFRDEVAELPGVFAVGQPNGVG
ncbi:MAG: MgtC/SapB family protein [Propionibacteriaceae bacterium]|jgi:putative Mg2+ transporter-C (MgtC) family protein|nr:MgtC/SapB family protein [Propionibacteriaceae bacterium]